MRTFLIIDNHVCVLIAMHQAVIGMTYRCTSRLAGKGGAFHSAGVTNAGVGVVVFVYATHALARIELNSVHPLKRRYSV